MLSGKKNQKALLNVLVEPLEDILSQAEDRSAILKYAVTLVKLIKAEKEALADFFFHVIVRNVPCSMK